MRFFHAGRAAHFVVALGALSTAMLSSSAQAGVGDLLVAPTRIVIDGNRGTEVVLDNIGVDVANYRISLELRRMDADGNLQDVPLDQANEHEKQTLDIISYAPRRVTLPPNQPQSIRVGVRAPEGLPDGEYRAHMVFRAIPDAPTATAATADKNVSIKLIPIYGVLIPVIVRRGNLQVSAEITDAHLGIVHPPKSPSGASTPEVAAVPALDFVLKRSGTRSVFGNIRVLRAGVEKPLLEVKGIAVYAEIAQRNVELALKPESVKDMHGPVTIEYREPDELGGGLITSLKTDLR